MKNKAGIKEMHKHIKDVKSARSSLKKDASDLKKDIGNKITHALKQDKIVLKDMKKVDKRK